jgi:D-aminopeptidase
VLVQANYGLRRSLRIAGVPVGKYLTDDTIYSHIADGPQGMGSIIIIAGTDAPLLPHQLKRIARRTSLGIAVNGGIGSNSSGDIFIAFSIANEAAAKGDAAASIGMVPNDSITPLFEATVQATEEAIINALVAGRDMTGDLGHRVAGIDHDDLRRILRQHNRLDD